MAEWIISSSVLILVVIGLRAVLKGKISLRLQYALWALVLLRLLVPVSFGSSNLSVMNVVEHTKSETVAAPVAVENANGETVDLTEPKPGANLAATPQKTQTPANTTQPSETESASKPVNIATVLLIVWGIGAAVVLVCFAATNFRFTRNAKRARQALSVAYCKLPVYVTDCMETPCLVGLLRPAIYLTPEATANKTVLWHTVEHEMTHYRHGDHIWPFLRCVCLVLHWYHPLVWWAAVLSRKDAELACDEATIRRIGEEERAEYGRTLIGLSCRKRPELLLTATTMTGSQSTLKERITLIARKPKTEIYTLIAIITITVIAVGCTFTGAKEEPKPTPPTEENTPVLENQTDSTPLPWEWAQGVTVDQLAWLNDDTDKQFVAEQLNSLNESDFSQVDTLSRDSMGIWVANGDSDSYSLCPSDTMDCVTLVAGEQYWDFSNPELRSFILDTYQEKLDSRKFIQTEPQRSIISKHMDDLLSSGEPSITLQLKDGSTYGPVFVSEWYTSYLTGDLDSYTWTEMEKTPEGTCDYQLVVASDDGTKRMTFRPDGVWGAVEYDDGNATAYWRATASADAESIAKKIRRCYDFSESSKPITFYVDGGAGEAAEYFAEHAFGEYMLSFAPGGLFTNIKYETRSWEVTEIREDNKAVTGFVYYAFQTEDGELHGGGNATEGNGEYEGMYVASQSFALRKEEDGHWRCWERGTGYLDLPQ